MANPGDGVDYGQAESADSEHERGHPATRDRTGPKRPWGDETPPEDENARGAEDGGGARGQGRHRQEGQEEEPEEGEPERELRPSLAQSILERHSGVLTPFSAGYPEERDVTAFLGADCTTVAQEVMSNPTYRSFWQDFIHLVEAVNRERAQKLSDYRHPHLYPAVDTPVPLPSQDPHFWASVIQALMSHTQTTEQVHGVDHTIAKVLCPWCRRKTAVAGFAKPSTAVLRRHQGHCTFTMVCSTP